MVYALGVAVVLLAALYAEMRLRWRGAEEEMRVLRPIALRRRGTPAGGRPVVLPFVRPVRGDDSEAPLESVR